MTRVHIDDFQNKEVKRNEKEDIGNHMRHNFADRRDAGDGMG